MRIISGKYKGKKLSLPEDKNTRPLKDLVKESIFNLLEHSKKNNVNFQNSSVLDLFSGTGSFGLECISRGSKNVFFFENYSKALNVLKKNLLSMKGVKNYKIFENDCFVYFNSNNEINQTFDVIFVDAPYKESKINNLLEKIVEKKLLNIGGLIIIHRHKKDTIEITNKVKILDIRSYGISKVYFAN